MKTKKFLLSLIVVLFVATSNLFAQVPPSGNFSVNPLPIQYTLSVSANEYCAGSDVDIFLSNSQFGISYELYDGGISTGDIISGTGSGLTWNNQLAGDYTIVATNPTTGCSQTMNGNEVVIENALPSVYNLTVSSNEYCAGSGGVDVQLSGSNIGITYELYESGVPTGDMISGDGAGLVWNGQLAGDYTIVATDDVTTCEQTMNGNEIVVEYARPTITSVNPMDVCNDGTLLQVDIDGLSGVAPLDVRLYVDGYAAGDLIHTEVGVVGPSATIFVDVSALPVGTFTLYGISVDGNGCYSHDEQ